MGASGTHQLIVAGLVLGTAAVLGTMGAYVLRGLVCSCVGAPHPVVIRAHHQYTYLMLFLRVLILHTILSCMIRMHLLCGGITYPLHGVLSSVVLREST